VTSKEVINNYKRPFYLSNISIIIASCLWILFGIGLLVAIILAFLQKRYDNKHMNTLHQVVKKEVEASCDSLIRTAQEEADQIKLNAEKENQHLANLTQDLIHNKNKVQETYEGLVEKVDKLSKQESNMKAKLSKLKPAHKAVLASVDFYRQNGSYTELDKSISDLLYPSVELPLHSYDVKVLKQKSNNVKKIISKLLEDYEARYTTKANQSIYSLMVIGLQAELQNVLINLKFDKIENTKTHINEIAIKYIDIAGKGNQNIYSTLVKFIGELESLFLQLADIEYEYYVKKEQQKEEQRLIREQMAQEAAERKLLKEQQKKIEKEELKFHQEINNLEEQLKGEKDDKALKDLKKRIEELTLQLNEVEHKKEDIINLQNGKAGNVYIISNIGSFGEDTFKIGMTRRLEPSDRIKELSSASIPFPFDVHSMIFSDDAPALEKRLHDILHNKRVNKVNLRKEFFNSSIDELETLVNDLDPTAEFKRTLVSYEYQQTLELINKEKVQ